MSNIRGIGNGSGAPCAAAAAVADASAEKQSAVWSELREGLARCMHRRGEVFYNKAQVVNRDLSVLMLRYYGQLRRREEEAAAEAKEKEDDANAPATREDRGRESEPELERRQQGGQSLSDAGGRGAARRLHVLEGLSATGLRALRYFREVPYVARVIANDLDAGAVDTIRRNVAHCGESSAECVVPNCADAYVYMATHRREFDVVDLDPYGSAAPLLDPAVQAVRNGGLLCVTCTDLRVLCGTQPEVSQARYHATAISSPYCHEQAIRIVLGAVAEHANRHGRHVEPLLSLNIDFYVRVFVRVTDARAAAKMQPSRTASVYHCGECSTFALQPHGRVRERERRGGGGGAPQRHYMPATGPPTDAQCAVCGSEKSGMLLGGPMYVGRLHAPEACSWLLRAVAADTSEREDAALEEPAWRLSPSLAELRPHLAARDRLRALLTVASEEVPDAPLFMHLPTMCKVLRCPSPPAGAVRELLAARLGYACSQTHHEPLALKTAAPPHAVWDLLREWVRIVGGVKSERLSAAAKRILGVREGDAEGDDSSRALLVPSPSRSAFEPPLQRADFDAAARRARTSAVRFPPNPEAHWGPKRAAKRARQQQQQQQHHNQDATGS